MMNQTLSSRIQDIFESDLSKREKARIILSMLDDDIKIILRGFKSDEFRHHNQSSYNKDLKQECYIMIFNLMETYKSSLPCSLYTYLMSSIKWRLRDISLSYSYMGIAKNGWTIRQSKLKSIYYLDSHDNDSSEILKDNTLIVQNNESDINEYFTKKFFKNKFKNNLLDYYIFYLIYYEDNSDSEIAMGLSLPLSKVKSSRRKLKKFISDNKEELKQFI